jgi:beta-lysine 5,6-aminomutase alpha subunit
MLNLKKTGLYKKRAHQVLDEALELLKKIEQEGLFNALEKGIFADIKRPKNGGKGLNGVVQKGNAYYNPFIGLMNANLK